MTDGSEAVRITKLVHGGQGMGTLVNGKKVFVWNALPGEMVTVRIIKQRRSYAEAIAEQIMESSAERVEPLESNYLATSPWQMMQFAAENAYKKQIVEELLQQQSIAYPSVPDTIHDERMTQYRNKMEYSFWGDENGLHLAMHRRGSHGKEIVQGSVLAISQLDRAANELCALLKQSGVRAGDLKTIIVRCSQESSIVGSLFIKPTVMDPLPLPPSFKGLRVYHSNPKSPASVPTKLLYELGDVHLEDTLLGKKFIYDSDSFFQVNVPVFEQALKDIAAGTHPPRLVDMYAGVGSIGLSVAERAVDLIELDSATAAMARVNAARTSLDARVIEASSEKSLEYIKDDVPVILDPPRVGLHMKLVERLLECQPPRITYLSCNPATQARDLALLQVAYSVESCKVYNFFPRTPHIETLAILTRKS